MADPAPDIVLPSDLRPADGRFGSGPSKVRPEALDALAATGDEYMGTSHRRPTVKDVVCRVRDGLSALYDLPADYEVLLGNGGTTVFWDAAILGLIERRSEHLSFGEFSSKFAKGAAAAPHLDPPVIVESEPGTRPEPVGSRDVDAYAFTHNETSTGVMMPIGRPPGTMESDEAPLVLVDATSAAGALAVDPLQFDCYYFAPQKAFGSDGGLWLAMCSPAAVSRIERISSSDRWIPSSLHLSIALTNSRKDQTYNTPALATLFLLAEQLDWMLDHGGLDWASGRSRESASILYGWADAVAYATPFVRLPADRSLTVATIDFSDDVDHEVLCNVLRRNGIVDVEPYRKLGRNQIRVALFPAIEPSDVETLTRAIDHVVARLT